jgi:hypothetical protein
MTEQAAIDQAADTASGEDANLRADEARMIVLIAQDTILTAREKALKKLKEPMRAELLLLLKRHGYMHRRTGEGKANLTERTTYKVTDVAKLIDLFAGDVPESSPHAEFWAAMRSSLGVVFDQIKVDKAFWTAAKKAHIKIEQAVVPEVGETFKVEAHKDRAAKERRQRIIQETQHELESRIEALARRMIERNATRSE